MRTGATQICNRLEALGVRTVFGLPGTQIVSLYEAIRRSGMNAVLATNETAAAFMAAGYYRASGRVAVVVTIPGPGFLFALTGLAEARHDSVGLVHVTCSVPSVPGKSFELQRIDQAAIAGPLVKLCLRIDQIEQIDEVLSRAFDVASDGEPGPVLVEVAPAILSAQSSMVSTPVKAHKPVRPQIDRVVDVAARISGSSRPLLFVGQGAAGAADLVQALAELLHAPVLTTLSGRGILPDDHRLALGCDLGFAVDVVNELVAESDLVLALGCKFSHNGSGGYRLQIEKDKLVHVDAASTSLNANYPASLSVESDTRTFLESLLPLLDSGIRGESQISRDLAPWRKRLPRTPEGAGQEPVMLGEGWEEPSAFFSALRAAMPRDAILVTDSGRHQVLARRHASVFCPRGFLAPSDFQSMGFGLPAAIGAAIANRARFVVALLGDGGLAMSGLELLTAVREQLPLTVVVFNDGNLGLIREQQLREYGQAYSVGLVPWDLATLAASIGADYMLFGKGGSECLRTLISSGRVTLVEVLVADSAIGRTAHLRSYIRARARGLIGPRWIAWVKRILTLHRPLSSGPPSRSGRISSERPWRESSL